MGEKTLNLNYQKLQKNTRSEKKTVDKVTLFGKNDCQGFVLMINNNLKNAFMLSRGDRGSAD